MSIAYPFASIPPPSPVIDTWYLDRITRPLDGVPIAVTCTGVAEKFEAFPDILALPVLRGHKPVGILSRAARYADLQAKVSAVVDPHPLILPHNVMLETVSRMAANRYPRPSPMG